MPRAWHSLAISFRSSMVKALALCERMFSRPMPKYTESAPAFMAAAKLSRDPTGAIISKSERCIGLVLAGDWPRFVIQAAKVAKILETKGCHGKDFSHFGERKSCFWRKNGQVSCFFHKNASASVPSPLAGRCLKRLGILPHRNAFIFRLQAISLSWTHSHAAGKNRWFVGVHGAERAFFCHLPVVKPVQFVKKSTKT